MEVSNTNYNNPGNSFIQDTQITTHALHLTGSNAVEVLSNAELFFDMQQYVQSFYQLEKLCTIYDVYNIEASVLGQEIKYFENDMPAVNIGNPLIKEKSDIYGIKNVNFAHNTRGKFVLELIALYRQKAGKDFKPRFCAPFSLAANIRGYNNLINDIYEDKKFVLELFRIINHEVLAPWILKQREAIGKSDIVASGADAWVAIPNVNLEIIEKIIIPSYHELDSLVGNIYLSLLGGARFMKKPERYLEVQKILNPFLVKGTGNDIEILGPEFFRDFAVKNNMDLLFGIEASLLTNNETYAIMETIKNYLDTGLEIPGTFTLYFNDIPAVISPEKLKQIFEKTRSLKQSKKY